MTRHALLNNTEHRDLRIINKSGAEYGDDVMCAITFPAEFRDVQSHYPIFFLQTREGVLVPVALLGLREKQNLFLTNGSWDARYVPLMIQRQPFLMGELDSRQVVHIDLDSPRVSKTEGVALFNEAGENSPYLEQVSKVLGAIHDGLAATPAFMDALTEHNLLDTFAIDIQFRDGDKFRFTGFHTIHEERLARLDGAALAKLHEPGYLQAIFMIVASVSRVRDLVERASKLDPAHR